MQYTFILILMLSFSACTQPGGRIGVYFGSWILQEIKVDDIVDSNYKDQRPIILSFQSNIFNMAPADAKEIYGLWEEKGNYLILDGTHHAGVFPPYLKWGDEALVEMLILKKKHNRLVLQWTSPSGTIYQYDYKKEL